MLSAKYTKVHGMRNEKWNTREKIAQYRTLLKLHARDKKLQTSNAAQLKKQVSKNLNEVKSDIRKYRQIVNDIVTGDKRLVRTILQSHKDFQTTLDGADPTEARVAIFQDYNLKRKQLDKLLHLKEKKKLDFCGFKSEWMKLIEEIDSGGKFPQFGFTPEHQRRQQQLIARYQVALAQRNAAKSVNETYHDIHNILKKDSMYYDAVLNALKNDQKDQGNVIYKTTTMAQLAVENLDDIRQRYKSIARDIWVNMEERQKGLEMMSKKMDNVWLFAKSLVRIDSDANLLKKKKKKTVDIDKKLQKQIEQLEKTFNIMKDSMLIRSYEELFIRLDDQIKQRTRLSRLYECNLKQRDTELNYKKHADLLLKNVENAMAMTTIKYRNEKKLKLEKIEEEKAREQNNNTLIESQGELLVKIRASLQNLAGLLMCIKAKSMKTRKSKDDIEVEVKSITTKAKSICDATVENEGLAVLSQVNRKAITLVGMTNFQLSKDREEKARNMYETHISECRSKMAFGKEDQKATDMYFEHEAVDSSVLTRADIKMRSKQIVEANAKED